MARTRISRGPIGGSGSSRSSTARGPENQTPVATATPGGTSDARSDTLQGPLDDQIVAAAPALNGSERDGVVQAQRSDVADGLDAGPEDLRRDADDDAVRDAASES